jgi:hypothetical protein
MQLKSMGAWSKRAEEKYLLEEIRTGVWHQQSTLYAIQKILFTISVAVIVCAISLSWPFWLWLGSMLAVGATVLLVWSSNYISSEVLYALLLLMFMIGAYLETRSRKKNV